MNSKLLLAATLLTLPSLAMAQQAYQYGYEESTTQSVDDDGHVSQTTVQQSWMKSPDAQPESYSITDVNAPADAQPEAEDANVESVTTVTTDEAEGQHPASWYQQHLQPSGRYVYSPEAGKLVPADQVESVQKLNAAAARKAK